MNTRLSEFDLCLLSVCLLGQTPGGTIGTDEQISSFLKRLLDLAGESDDKWTWQMGKGADWYLEEVARFTDRLIGNEWASEDSPYRFTPTGRRMCATLLRQSMNDDGEKAARIRELTQRAGFRVDEVLREAN